MASAAVAAAKAGKRPLRSLTAHEKLTAIRRVHDGESKASVARDIGVPESTLRGWCKNEEKISYLSRQSSPDSDESSGEHPIVKRPRTDDLQPYNLSLKAAAAADPDLKKPPLSVDHDTGRTKLAKLSAEMGLNRPEVFASAAAGSNNFNGKSPSELVGLFLQWNSVYQQTLFLQQKLQKGKAAAVAAGAGGDPATKGLLTTVDKAANSVAAAEQLLGYDLAAYWLQNQQRLNANNTSNTAAANNTVAEQQRWWANYYKKMFANLPLQNLAANNTTLTASNNNNNNLVNAHSTAATGHSTNYTAASTATTTITTTAAATSSSAPFSSTATTSTANNHNASNNITPEKPILYQQLTKQEVAAAAVAAASNKEPEVSENATEESTTTPAKPKPPVKGRSVLDNILLNNNTIRADGKRQEGESLSQHEALEHGLKFLRWLETCGDPSVTAVQILTLQSLIKNLRAERKNGEVHSKAKVKRK